MPQVPSPSLTKSASATLGKQHTTKTQHANKHQKGRHAPAAVTTKSDEYSKQMKRTTSSIHRNIEEIMAARLVHDGGRLSILPAPKNVVEFAKGGAQKASRDHLVSSSINAARRSRMKRDAAISGIAAGSDNTTSAVINQAPKHKKFTKADQHRLQLQALIQQQEEQQQQQQQQQLQQQSSTIPTSTAGATVSEPKRKRKSSALVSSASSSASSSTSTSTSSLSAVNAEAAKRERKRAKYIREMQGQIVSSDSDGDSDHDGDSHSDGGQ